MDTSETYIKMCGRAEEVQQQAKQLRNPSSLLVLENGVMLNNMGDYWMDNVWLPRQDELQEMLDEPLRSRVMYGDAVLGSWEQFYLHIVMKEKYGKVWGGENWMI